MSRPEIEYFANGFILWGSKKVSVCPECKLPLGMHKDDCRWGRDLAPRYGRVASLIQAWREGGDVRKLREAQDALSELVAHASPLNEPVDVFEGKVLK